MVVPYQKNYLCPEKRQRRNKFRLSPFCVAITHIDINIFLKVFSNPSRRLFISKCDETNELKSVIGERSDYTNYDAGQEKLIGSTRQEESKTKKAFATLILTEH